MPHKFKIGDVVSYHPSDRMLSTATTCAATSCAASATAATLC
jgi:hypothetical protein